MGWGVGRRGEVAQTMYIHESKRQNNKIKGEGKKKKMLGTCSVLDFDFLI
jgi:hypothetical protein